VIVATHDPEFAAACADRAILMADGRVIADGTAAELLAGGWYFATETARILGGAAGALTPEQGAELLAARGSAAVRAAPRDLASSREGASAPADMASAPRDMASAAADMASAAALRASVGNRAR
jgi:ABC-type multidrug transport system ATPase subunit